MLYYSKSLGGVILNSGGIGIQILGAFLSTISGVAVALIISGLQYLKNKNELNKEKTLLIGLMKGQIEVLENLYLLNKDERGIVNKSLNRPYEIIIENMQHYNNQLINLTRRTDAVEAIKYHSDKMTISVMLDFLSEGRIDSDVYSSLKSLSQYKDDK